MAAGQSSRRRGRELGPAVEIFLWSRLALWAAALFAVLTFEPSRNPSAFRWDSPRLHDLGAVTDVWARWDSDWLLRIAEHGYAAAPSSTPAFPPLYPALAGGLGRILGGHYVPAGILVSLAACLGAFLLLHRLAEEKLGLAGARRAVLYVAIFPMSLFLQAVYSESLFLVLALAAFLLAERGRFPAAGAAAGLAGLARLGGVALLPALALLAWRAPDRRRALASLLLAPALWLLYPAWLWIRIGEPLALFRAQEGIWQRHLSAAGPLGGLWHGLDAGWAGIRQLLSGSHTTRYWQAVTDADPLRVAAINLEQLAFTVLFLALAAVAWRRLGAPYGLFAALGLALPLSFPSERWPLLSLSRFGLVLFPLFLALAALGERPRLHAAIVSVSSLLLGVAVVQWALWQWVA